MFDGEVCRPEASGKLSGRETLLETASDNEEEMTLNFGKKILALLMVAVLLVAVIPAANATQVTEATEATEYVGEKATAHYVELRRQLAIGNGLKRENFTGDSWAVLA
jgi:hypothetical protein